MRTAAESGIMYTYVGTIVEKRKSGQKCGGDVVEKNYSVSLRIQGLIKEVNKISHQGHHHQGNTTPSATSSATEFRRTIVTSSRFVSYHRRDYVTAEDRLMEFEINYAVNPRK